MQFHMIGRGDDVHHMKTKSLHVHPKFDFALETSMSWSKNVLEERDCPPQIMLGAANPVVCIILSLAIYLEERFSRFGLNSVYLYTEDVGDSAPKNAVKSYSKTIREKVPADLLACTLSGSCQLHGRVCLELHRTRSISEADGRRVKVVCHHGTLIHTSHTRMQKYVVCCVSMVQSSTSCEMDVACPVCFFGSMFAPK